MYILLTGVILYSFFLKAVEWIMAVEYESVEYGTNYSKFKEITNLCGLSICFFVLFVNYFKHYFYYFTKQPEESVLSN